MIMSNNKYVRLTDGLKDKGELIPADEFDKDATSDRDMYASVYYYNEDHYKEFLKTGSVKGIENVKTDKLVFDFDNEENPDVARRDAVELVKRLKSEGIKEDHIDAYFSGNKGISIVLQLDKELNPTQAAHLALKKFGKDLSTLDPSMYNASRIFRLPNTKHQESGLYKIQLSLNQLEKLSMDLIKKSATSIKKLKDKSIVNLPTDWINNIEQPKEVKLLSKPNTNTRPPYWKDYKWAMVQGQFLIGERHNAMMVIAATCRGLGYDRDLTKAICLNADEKHQALTKHEAIDLEALENEVLDSVFSDDWNGGQYSYKNNPWLQKYCTREGFDVNQSTDELTVEIDSVYDLFKTYATNIDKLTIKTGIKSLDQNLMMTIGTTVGIVAAPGSGKTSLSLQILNAMSKRGEQCIFFSYDMYHALVFQKLIQKHFNVEPEVIFEKFKSGDKEFEDKVVKVIKEEYKNVEFCFRSGQSPNDIIQTIKYVKEKTNKEIRLVVVDYSELVMSDYSDSTQASAFVAQRLREIANTYNLCVIVLLQPNKMSGGPAEEIKSYTNAKGSGTIAQALTVMLGLYRPGYDPANHEEDQFMTINCLKNRMGKLFKLDYKWDGLRGTIHELTSEQKAFLQEVLDRKQLESESKESYG